MPIINLRIENRATAFLGKLPPKHFKQIQIAIYRLMNNPEQHDSKPLCGAEFSGLWRNDSGEYRIIYRYNAETLHIVTIGKRNDNEVYKQLKRLI